MLSIENGCLYEHTRLIYDSRDANNTNNVTITLRDSSLKELIELADQECIDDLESSIETLEEERDELNDKLSDIEHFIHQSFIEFNDIIENENLLPDDMLEELKNTILEKHKKFINKF